MMKSFTGEKSMPMYIKKWIKSSWGNLVRSKNVWTKYEKKKKKKTV